MVVFVLVDATRDCCAVFWFDITQELSGSLLAVHVFRRRPAHSFIPPAPPSRGPAARRLAPPQLSTTPRSDPPHTPVKQNAAHQNGCWKVRASSPSVRLIASLKKPAATVAGIRSPASSSSSGSSCPKYTAFYAVRRIPQPALRLPQRQRRRQPFLPPLPIEPQISTFAGAVSSAQNAPRRRVLV